MTVHAPGAFLPPAEPPRPGARVSVVESFSGIVHGGRVHRDPHPLSGGPQVLIDGFRHVLLLPGGEGILWARGGGHKTRAALEAAFRLSGIA